MSSSDGLTDPDMDQETSKLISMFPLSWATAVKELGWHEIVGSEGDDSLQIGRCKVNQQKRGRGRNIKDPSEDTILISFMVSKS